MEFILFSSLQMTGWHRVMEGCGWSRVWHLQTSRPGNSRWTLSGGGNNCFVTNTKPQRHKYRILTYSSIFAVKSEVTAVGKPHEALCEFISCRHTWLNSHTSPDEKKERVIFFSLSSDHMFLTVPSPIQSPDVSRRKLLQVPGAALPFPPLKVAFYQLQHISQTVTGKISKSILSCCCWPTV